MCGILYTGALTLHLKERAFPGLGCVPPSAPFLCQSALQVGGLPAEIFEGSTPHLV